MKLMAFLSAVLASAALAAAETVDLVSAKGTKATLWVTFDAPADGTFTAKAVLDGFAPQTLVVTKEPRDPNAFFTDLPGIGEKVPTGVGFADGAKGFAAKAGEAMTVRVVVPVAKDAKAGVHKGTFQVACGGKTIDRELWLKVLDFELPAPKARYSGRAWTTKYDGDVPADWTPETPETYTRDCAKVSSVAGSLWNTKNDLMSERWRGLGVPYYAMLDIPYVINPDAWRRAAGTKAWLLGFDGVALPKGKKVDPVVAAGLEDAAIDVAYLSYCSELSNDLADRAKHPVKVTYEGRLGQFWCDRIKVGSDDMDVVRLENQARIVRHLAFVRKETSK